MMSAKLRVLMISLLVAVPSLNAAAQSTKKVDTRTCGAECLFMALCAQGKGDTRYSDLKKEMGTPTADGYSMLELRDAARKHGCFAECVQLKPEQLADTTKDCSVIIHLEPNHFQICLTVRKDQAEICDPSGLRGYVDIEDLAENWQCNCVLVSAQPIEVARPRSGYNLFWLLGGVVLVVGSIVIWKYKQR
jgi:ABC-type bacteriocin/lantibiotic exporter with double-glycine peptidase domain